MSASSSFTMNNTDHFTTGKITAPAHVGEDTILIAVMGGSGTGKTSFINLASGSDLRVGHGLESCTNTVQTSEQFDIDGKKVVLIDTPGFDDTEKSDADILHTIAISLSVTYQKGPALTAVLYCHRITDPRLGGLSKKNFTMFRAICGDEYMKNVIIVTTMWDRVEEGDGSTKEDQLRTNGQLFEPAVDTGARMLRHYNTAESARTIVRNALEKAPLPLQLQQELVDQNMDISQTAAGIQLDKELLQLAEERSKNIEKLKREMEEATRSKDNEMRAEIEDEIKKHNEELRRIEEERNNYAAMYKKRKAEVDEEMKKMNPTKKVRWSRISKVWGIILWALERIRATPRKWYYGLLGWRRS